MVIELQDEGIGSKPDVLGSLRRATRWHLEQYDRAVDLAQMSESRARYRWFLEKMYGFYDPVEDRLDDVFNSFEKAGFDVSARRKSSDLLLDLLSLGLSRSDLDEIQTCEHVPEISSTAQALGVLFVLEELIIGGEFIGQLLTQRIGIDAGDGSRFFSGYGSNSTAMNRELARILFANITEEEEQSAISAACETFDMLLSWLADGAPAVQKCS